MNEKIKELEDDIQQEIYRIQMIDNPTPNTNSELHKMQKELKELKLQQKEYDKGFKDAMNKYRKD